MLVSALPSELSTLVRLESTEVKSAAAGVAVALVVGEVVGTGVVVAEVFSATVGLEVLLALSIFIFKATVPIRSMATIMTPPIRIFDCPVCMPI